MVNRGCAALVRLPMTGDTDCDGNVNFGEINAFVELLTGGA